MLGTTCFDVLVHASTSATYADLDMLEIGNGDFSAANLPQAQAHMSMWAIMKVGGRGRVCLVYIFSVLKGRGSPNLPLTPSCRRRC